MTRARHTESVQLSRIEPLVHGAHRHLANSADLAGRVDLHLCVLSYWLNHLQLGVNSPGQLPQWYNTGTQQTWRSVAAKSQRRESWPRCRQSCAVGRRAVSNNNILPLSVVLLKQRSRSVSIRVAAWTSYKFRFSYLIIAIWRIKSTFFVCRPYH